MVPKKIAGKGWCLCDRDKVGELGQCPVCFRYSKKTKKKKGIPPLEIEDAIE